MSSNGMTPGPSLAMDTATRTGSVAIGVEGAVLAELDIGVDVRHSESLLPAIEFALDRAGIEPDGLRSIIVGAGPGSFTGVRIAAATAKGLAWSLGVPLFAYSSLEALAAGSAVSGRAVCAVLDARRDDVYGACYRFHTDAPPETLIEPVACTVDELVAMAQPHDAVFAGDGASRHAERIARKGGQVAIGPVAHPRASALLWLAHHVPRRGRVEQPAAWQPDYVRPPGARPMT